MKKSIKTLALGLAVIPCALLLTACGGNNNQGLVDVKGNYSNVQVEEYSSVATKIDENLSNDSSFIDGVRIVLDVKAKMPDSTMTVKMDNKVKNISKIGTEESSQVVASSNLKMTTSAGKESYSQNLNSYVSNNNAYIDMSNFLIAGPQIMPTKLYIPLPVSGEDESDAITLPEINFTKLLEDIPAELLGDTFVIQTYENEGEYKVKATIKGEFLYEFLAPKISDLNSETYQFELKNAKDLVVYVVFKDNNISGIRVETSFKIVYSMYMESISFENIPMDISAKLEATAFDGEITLPSFDDYQPMPEQA